MIISNATPSAAAGTNSLSNLQRLKGLEERLNNQLFDQPEAVHCAAEMIKRIETGFCDETKPKGVLVFAGPTGVGKTELAKLVAQELEVPLHRFDMAEFPHSADIRRLIGSPPGYQDSQDGGQLVNTLMRTPKCVVLFDEIEKAHSSLYKTFLGLFDEGRLADARGTEVSATNAVFILTTNLASEQIYQQFKDGVKEGLNREVKSIFKKTFSSELYNRFDQIVPFRPLRSSAIERIAEKYLNTLKTSLSKKGLEITWDRKVVVRLAKLPVDLKMGARDIHRKIKDAVLPKLVTSRIEGKILQTEARIHMKIVDGRLEIDVLDKGREVVAPVVQKKPKAEEKDHTAYNAITLKDGVVCLDFRKNWSPHALKGLYVQDNFGIGDPKKIIEISSVGEIIYSHTGYGGKKETGVISEVLSSDNSLRPVTPAQNGRAFFENVCCLIEPLDIQQQAVQLVDKIFSGSGREGGHLSERALFHSLKEYCIQSEKSELVKDVESLEQLIGPLSVTILTNKAGSSSGKPRPDPTGINAKL